MGNDSLFILLADDDADDRLFFKEAMEEINADSLISFVNDGIKLMYFLNQPGIRLPNIVFIDLNMPVKNGMECLKEIRANKRFKDLVIAIYSTSAFSEVSDAGNVSTWTYRDPNISETADSVAPCHQTIGLYTTFKVERLNQTPDGRWTWQLVMDCNAGGGWQQLDNRSSHFKAGRSLGEFEAQFSGVEQYAHEYGLRERVNSTWNSWSGIQCDPTPQFMTTHVAPVSNSEYVTSTSGSVC